MPNGVPVATVALNASKNAGLLAAQILATSNDDLAARYELFKQDMREAVQEKVELLQKEWDNSFDGVADKTDADKVE